MPSVRTTTAARWGKPPATRLSLATTRAILAVASYRDVWPYGFCVESSALESCDLLEVKPLTWSRPVSNVKTAAWSIGLNPAKTWSATCRASTVFAPTRMLPLMSTSTASFTGPSDSDRKSRILRGTPPSTILKSSFDRSLTKRPLRSRTTAATDTTSTDERKRGVDWEFSEPAWELAGEGNAISAARSMLVLTPAPVIPGTPPNLLPFI